MNWLSVSRQPFTKVTSAPLRNVWVGLCIAYPLIALVSISAANILLIVIVLGWFFFHSEIPTSQARPLFYLIVLYLAWTLVAMVISPLARNWSTWVEERSTFLAVIPGLVLGSNQQWLRKSFGYVSVLLIPLAIYAVCQYYTGWDVLRMKPLEPLFDRYHATGLQNFHLTFAGMIVLATPIAISLNSARLFRSGAIAVAGAISVLSSMARAMILGLYGCGGLFLLFGSRKLRIVGIALILVLVIIPSTIYSASGERLLRGLGASQADVQQGDPTRIYLWKSAINIIRHYPIAGVGEDNWNAVFEQYKEPYDNYSSTAHAHNDFLSAAVDHGIIGGAILIALWAYILFRSIRSVHRAKGYQRDLRLGFLASFLAILFGGMLQNYQTDAEVALLLWFLVGVSVQLPGGMNALKAHSEGNKT